MTNQNALSVAVTAAMGLGMADNVSALAVSQIVVQDVGSTLNGVDGGGSGTYSSALDGRSGGFRFNVINPSLYSGASLWTGDVGSGAILGQGAPNPTGSFSTGFSFLNDPLVPYTFGSGMNADISGGVLSFSSMDFGGNFAGLVNLDMPPDAGTLKVNWVVPTADPNDFLVSFQWEHYLTTTADPSYCYGCYTARWIVEGIATVVPVPAATWLFGSGVIGLAGVARRRRSRRV